MPDANELKAALERLIAGTASEADGNALRTALTTGVLVPSVRPTNIEPAFEADESPVSILTSSDLLVASTFAAPAETMPRT